MIADRITEETTGPPGLFHVLYLLHEHFGRLESGNAVLRDDDCSVLGDVTGSLLRANLDDEAAKSAQIHIFAMCERIFHDFHELLDGIKNV